jgi:hypothetical protein
LKKSTFSFSLFKHFVHQGRLKEQWKYFMSLMAAGSSR